MQAKYKKIYCILIFSLIILSNCFAEKGWRKSQEGIYLWTDISTSFSWTGNYLGEKFKFANGTGSIKYKETNISKEFIFGVEEKDFTQNKDGSLKYRFSQNGKIEGFGVIIRDNSKVFTGYFVNKQQNGDGELFINKQLVFTGAFKDGKKNGFGCEISIKNRTRETGKFVEGVKDGPFTISFENGKKVEFNYINGVMDTSFGKITDAAGRTWEGPINESFEENGNGRFINENGIINQENRYAGNIEGINIKRYADGSVYEGEFKDSKKNGYGILKYSNGFRYEGNWKDDNHNGYGVLFYNEDDFYAGNWIFNEALGYSVFHGTGLLFSSDFIYDGEWINGKKSGQGYYQDQNVIYDGNWENDEITGYGVATYIDGSIYEGYFKNFERHGYGKYTWANGNSYEGFWEKDIPDGEGAVHFQNGDSYIGDFANGQFNGMGKYSYANGTVYEGSFVNNKKEGLGTISYNKGDIYQGEFVADKPNGKGTYYYINGNFYEGEFDNGCFNGEGTFYFYNNIDEDFSVLHSINWKGNTFPTDGDFYFPNGDCFSGYLKNGAPTESGSWSTAEDRYYERPLAQRANDLFKEHKEEINTILKYSETAIFVTEITLMATPVVLNGLATVCTFIPCAQEVAPALAAAATGVKTANKVVLPILDKAQKTIIATRLTLNTVSVAIDFKYAYDEKDSELMKALVADWYQECKTDLTFLVIQAGITVVPKVIPKVAKKILESPLSRSIGKKLSKIGTYPLLLKTGKYLKAAGGSVKNFIAHTKVGKALGVTSKGIKVFFSRFVVISKYGSEFAKYISKLSLKDANRISNYVFKYGDDAFEMIQKHRDELAELFAKHGDDVGELLARYGDDAFDIIKQQGDDGIYFLKNADPRAIKYAKQLGESFEKLYESLSDIEKNKLLYVLETVGGKNNNPEKIKEVIDTINKCKNHNILDALANTVSSRNWNDIKQVLEGCTGNVLKSRIENLATHDKLALKFYKRYGNRSEEIIKRHGFPPPYFTGRPAYGKNQVNDVWNKASKNGKKTVRDPHTGEILTNTIDSKTGRRDWDMGHRTGREYRDLYDRFMNGEIDEEEFLREYRDPNNYIPESPSANRSHKFEMKN